MRFKQVKMSILKADGKELVFKDGVVEVKKVTKDIQFFIDQGYIKEIKEELNDGETVK